MGGRLWREPVARRRIEMHKSLLSGVRRVGIGLTISSWPGEAALNYNDSTWTKWTGEPQPLEMKGIYSGHAWYRTELNFDHAPYLVAKL